MTLRQERKMRQALRALNAADFAWDWVGRKWRTLRNRWAR